MSGGAGNSRALYLCYFGLREPLVQTQVLPYLRSLADAGIECRLLTFEPHQPAGPRDDDDWRARLQVEGIAWSWLRYHKRPSLPATLYDILAGALFAVTLSRRARIDVLHARGHVPAAMGALVKRWTGARLIFDIRGFLPEEYVDGGVWRPNGRLFRWTKAAERYLFAASDGFVVLTERAKERLFPGCTHQDQAGRPFEVIPCCVDLERFRLPADTTRREWREALGLNGRQVFAYAGVLGGWILHRDMAVLFAEAHRRDPKAFFLVLSRSRTDDLVRCLHALGVPDDSFSVRAVTPAEVPYYLAAADVGVAFIKAHHSKVSSSPVKVSEYLAMGLPVVHNAGVGDLDDVIEPDGVGVTTVDCQPASLRGALSRLDILLRDPDLRARCRSCAETRFDLERVGGLRYRRLYSRVLESAGMASVEPQRTAAR